MGKNIYRVKNAVIVIGLILIDLAVYIFLGLTLMNYDDFYDESKGPYWSLDSMTSSEKMTFIGLNVWYVLNVFVLGWVIYRIVRLLKRRSP